MDYRQSFLELLESLKENTLIEVLRDYVGVAVPEDDYSYQLTFKHFNIRLTERLAAFYHSMSGCQIEWQCDLNKHRNIKKYHADDSVLSGQIYIRPLDQMLEFDKKLEAEWWINNLSEDEKKDLYDFRYFDFNDDYIRVGFIKEDNVINAHKLYFLVQESEGFMPVNLSFDEYIEKWLTYRGYQGWQYGYFFNNTENHKRMMHYLDQLFAK